MTEPSAGEKSKKALKKPLIGFWAMASLRAGRPSFKCFSALRFFFVLSVVFSFWVAEFFFLGEHEEEARLLAGRREDVACAARRWRFGLSSSLGGGLGARCRVEIVRLR